MAEEREPWTSGNEYATRYATYAAYTRDNTVAELTTALDYLNNEYSRYGLANGTNEHPYDLSLVANADYSSGQDSWATTENHSGSGSFGIASDGTQKNYFNSTFNTWMRHATVYQEGILVDEGIYRLSARMKGSPKDDTSTFIYATTGAVAHWEDPVFKGTTFYGYLTTEAAGDWSTVEAYITLDAPATLRIGVLSWGNNWNGGTGGAFAVDDWALEKIDYALTTKGGVATVAGPAPLAAISAALSEDVAVLDLTKATSLASAEIPTSSNPNLLILATSGQVSNATNVVVDGTCASLRLEKGHPFVNPAAFTATNAAYTLSAEELAGGSFATLMLPFRVTSLPGQAFVLDQGVDLMGGTMQGTATGTIEANKPVLVTGAGTYSGSGVEVPAVASGATFSNGELTGTYTATAAPASSYVLQNHTAGEGVAFYLVGTTRPTVNPFRAYIKAQSNNVKALRVLFDEDGISAPAIPGTDAAEAGIYSLSGQRLHSLPRKGVCLVNGKKLIIK